MPRAHPLLGVDVAVVPANWLLDPVRAHLPERGPSFVWAPDPGPGRRSGRRRKKTPGTNRADRPVATSWLSLHGLVRHMAEVERSWFRRVLQREPGAPYIWFDPAIEDSEMVPLDGAVWETDLAAWQAECEASRKAAAARSLNDTGLTRSGEPCSLRWIYIHMIEEYARHNGHADLIRELTDGAVGW